MSKTYTERGFANYADFVDTYGTNVVVRQSSSATDDCVWVFTKGGTENNDGSTHLNIEQAIKLISALSEWLADVTSEEQPHE